MKKLTKTQIWEMVQEIAKTTVQDNSDLFKKDNAEKFETTLVASLAAQLQPKTGGGTSNKVNDAGEVYCNYFGVYMTEDNFGKKLSKPDKITGERREVFKANSKAAEAILRRIKALKANVTKQATEAIRCKYIDEEEFTGLLNKLDEISATKYSSIDEVPTPAEVVGLANAMNKAAKEDVADSIDVKEDYEALADEIEAME